MIEIDVVSASARQNGLPIDLPPRELALLTSLAIGPKTWPSYQLVPLLWPQAKMSRCTSLKVYIHRLRRRLGPSVIRSTNKGYELDPSVKVDLWEARALLSKPTLSEPERQMLSRFYSRALSADRSYLSRWDWFSAAEGLITSAISEVALRLAREASMRDKFEEAATIMRSAASLNPSEQRLQDWQSVAIS